MSDNDSNKPFDPFEAWRGLQQSTMDAWAKALIQTVNTDAYAHAMGAVLDTYLAASSPFHETIEKVMSQSLRQLNVPTREDFVSLAERLTHIEMRLDDLDAKLDDMERRRAESAQALAARLDKKADEAEGPRVAAAPAGLRKKESK